MTRRAPLGSSLLFQRPGVRRLDVDGDEHLSTDEIDLAAKVARESLSGLRRDHALRQLDALRAQVEDQGVLGSRLPPNKPVTADLHEGVQRIAGPLDLLVPIELRARPKLSVATADAERTAARVELRFPLEQLGLPPGDAEALLEGAAEWSASVGTRANEDSTVELTLHPSDDGVEASVVANEILFGSLGNMHLVYVGASGRERSLRVVPEEVRLDDSMGHQADLRDGLARAEKHLEALDGLYERLTDPAIDTDLEEHFVALERRRDGLQASMRTLQEEISEAARELADAERAAIGELGQLGIPAPVFVPVAENHLPPDCADVLREIGEAETARAEANARATTLRQMLDVLSAAPPNQTADLRHELRVVEASMADATAAVETGWGVLKARLHELTVDGDAVGEFLRGVERYVDSSTLTDLHADLRGSTRERSDLERELRGLDEDLQRRDETIEAYAARTDEKRADVRAEIARRKEELRRGATRILTLRFDADGKRVA